MRKVATLTLPPGGFPPLQSGVLNQRWATSGQRGDVTPTAGGIPTVSQRGAESEVAHQWARWLNNPCRLVGPQRFRAGGRIRDGPQVGKVASLPLPPGGSPPFHIGGHNQRWPTSDPTCARAICGPIFLTPANLTGLFLFRAVSVFLYHLLRFRNLPIILRPLISGFTHF